ncbi:MAG: hypothetical protein WCF10_07760, partial [Polyangiales bacterium]
FDRSWSWDDVRCRETPTTDDGPPTRWCGGPDGRGGRSRRRVGDAVRREYGYVPEEAYREGRRHFLQALLERTAIYANLALRDLLECAARRNLRDACRQWVVSDGLR